MLQSRRLVARLSTKEKKKIDELASVLSSLRRRNATVTFWGGADRRTANEDAVDVPVGDASGRRGGALAVWGGVRGT